MLTTTAEQEAYNPPIYKPVEFEVVEDGDEEDNLPEPNEYAIDVDPKEKRCLALVIYHEARNQSLDGQIGVATVALNRVRPGMHPNSICEVVFAKNAFSWTNSKRKMALDPATQKNEIERAAWNNALALANDIILEYNSASFSDITGGATFFHASYVFPEWRKRLQRTVRLGQHIFYKEKGRVYASKG